MVATHEPVEVGGGLEPGLLVSVLPPVEVGLLDGGFDVDCEVEVGAVLDWLVVGGFVSDVGDVVDVLGLPQ